MKVLRFTAVLLLALAAALITVGFGGARSINETLPQDEGVLCGNGSASENYGFTYPLMQPHWTVNWEHYVREGTVDEVDRVLDELDADYIAQTMILFQPADQVGMRVNCAVHFLRYMQLGQPEGERKDNGFVFLIVVEDNKIDVHYGVGLGLPALTAQGLTPLNRLTEETYESTESMDEALLALVYGFDEYARSKYDPWYPPATTQTPTGTGSPSFTLIICVICIGILLLLLIVFLVTRRSRGRGGGRSGGGIGPVIISSPRRFKFPSIPRRSSRGGSRAPRSRGGSGSGRSHRGN